MKTNNERERAREAAFDQWLTENRLNKIVPKDGHSRRAFNAGYDAASTARHDAMEEVLRELVKAHDECAAALDHPSYERLGKALVAARDLLTGPATATQEEK